ncbi:MAG TPA: ATP-binding protein [Polyangiaceae bacterium]|nr:ATP-binding protein [Polyangiaceae bacterium]
MTEPGGTPARWRENKVVACGVAVAAVLAVTGVKLLFPDWIGHSVPVTAYLGAVMFAAWFGGTLPGLVATALFSVLCAYFFVAPYGSLAIASSRDAVRILIGGIEGSIVSILSGQLRSARLAAQQRSVELEKRAAAFKRLNGELRQAQKMTSVGHLAAGAIHDFNNWLSIVINHSDLLLRRLEGDHPAAEHARELRATSQQAANLAARLLAFSRPRESRANAIDLNRVLRDLEPILRSIVPPEVELETSYDDDADEARADKTHVEQVIVNLVANAADAIEGKGTIHVSTARCADGVHLEVRDTGAGMDAATKERIFEPFFTTKAKGTGLGLTVVQSIVDENGGTLQVESTPGAGSTFRVTWPASPAER